MEAVKKKKFQQLFHLFDANSNGHLDMSDAVIIMDRFREEFGWNTGGDADRKFRGAFLKIWTKLFREADENHDKVISEKEFIKYYLNVTANDLNFYAYLKPFLDELFPAIDQNQDGILSKENFCAFYRACNNSPADAEKTFREMDSNRDGVISHLEFYTMFYQFHMSENPKHPSRHFFRRVA